MHVCWCKGGAVHEMDVCERGGLCTRVCKRAGLRVCPRVCACSCTWERNGGAMHARVSMLVGKGWLARVCASTWV